MTDEREERLPTVPSFFAPTDLPDWLQPSDDVRAATTTDIPRARLAWALPQQDRDVVSPEMRNFQTAADATWHLTARITTAKQHGHGRFSRNIASSVALLCTLVMVAIDRLL